MKLSNSTPDQEDNWVIILKLTVYFHFSLPTPHSKPAIQPGVTGLALNIFRDLFKNSFPDLRHKLEPSDSYFLSIKIMKN